MLVMIRVQQSSATIMKKLKAWEISIEGNGLYHLFQRWWNKRRGQADGIRVHCWHALSPHTPQLPRLNCPSGLHDRSCFGVWHRGGKIATGDGGHELQECVEKKLFFLSLSFFSPSVLSAAKGYDYDEFSLSLI